MALAHAMTGICLAFTSATAFGAGCDALAGEWNWFTGGVVTLRDNHTILYDGRSAGKWECTDAARGAATLRWDIGTVDSVTVSGNRISGTNQQGIGISGTRRGAAHAAPPAAVSETPAPAAPRLTPPAPDPAAVSATPNTLQRCIGVVPGQPWPQKPGPSPATMEFCRQLPAWNAYEQARQRFEARDHAGAAQLLLGAAQAGNGMAAVRLAIMYHRGDGVAVNKREAFRWYLSAAQAGEPAAQNEAGSFYEAGAAGVKEDWVEAARWYRLSARLGWNKGQLSLGRAYQYGIGVPLDLQTATEWYARAAAQGNSQAAYFENHLKNNSGFDASTMNPEEQALYGSGLRTSSHTVQPPAGQVFHNKAERLNYIRTGLARIVWADYDACLKGPANPEERNRPRVCTPPSVPRP